MIEPLKTPCDLPLAISDELWDCASLADALSAQIAEHIDFDSQWEPLQKQEKLCCMNRLAFLIRWKVLSAIRKLDDLSIKGAVAA